MITEDALSEFYLSVITNHPTVNLFNKRNKFWKIVFFFLKGTPVKTAEVLPVSLGEEVARRRLHVSDLSLHHLLSFLLPLSTFTSSCCSYCFQGNGLICSTCLVYPQRWVVDSWEIIGIDILTLK